MTIRITDLNNINPNTGEPVSYLAYSEDDCADAVGRSVYQMACLLGDVVCTGKIIGEPVNS